MADLMTKPHAWLRTLSDDDLRALIDRVPDEGPLSDVRDNYGWEQTIEGQDYRIPVGWAMFELQVREQISRWTGKSEGA